MIGRQRNRLAGAAVLGCLLALSAPGSAQELRPDWPMPRGDAAGRGAVRLPLAGEGLRLGQQAWQFQAGSHVWGYQPGMAVWSSAAIGLAGGRPLLVVGSYDNNIYALDARNGERRWRFTTGGGVYSAPVIWRGQGRPLVFAGSSDRLIYAIDADLGRREWVHAVKTWRPTMGGARLSSPCLGRVRGVDAVFVGHWVWDKSLSGHLQAGGVTALEAVSGRLLWTTPLGDNQLSAPVFAEVDGSGRLFVASENGNTYALSADSGKVSWSHLDRNAIRSAPVLFHDQGRPRLIVGGRFGRVRCLDARSGAEQWSFRTANWVDASAAVDTEAGQSRVFVGSYDNQLYALDGHSGAPIWSYRTGAPIYSSPALLRERGHLRVLVSSWDHHLHCLDADEGRLLWKIFTGRPLWDSVPLGESSWASPSVAVLGSTAWVYQGSYAGPLHGMPLEEAARSGLARPGSNRRFWMVLPVSMGGTVVLTLLLTWWSRRRERLGSGLHLHR